MTHSMYFHQRRSNKHQDNQLWHRTWLCLMRTYTFIELWGYGVEKAYLISKHPHVYGKQGYLNIKYKTNSCISSREVKNQSDIMNATGRRGIFNSSGSRHFGLSKFSRKWWPEKMTGGSRDVGLGQGDEQMATMACPLLETLSQLKWPVYIKNNGILKVILSFVEKGQFRSKKLFSQPTSQPISQLRNTLRNGALAAKLGIFMLCSFAAVSQLWNGGSCTAKWHSCAKLGFAASKIFVEETMELRNDFAKDGRFRRDTSIPQRLLLGCEMASQRGANFAEVAKSRRPLFLLCFHSVFAPISLR